jgi:hypothetical protein
MPKMFSPMRDSGPPRTQEPSIAGRSQFLIADTDGTACLTCFPVPALPSALAVIDGTLFHLTRKGASAGFLTPLATAVLEFKRGPMCIYIREHPFGLLPGIPNLYCVDASLRLQWIAEWPDASDPCTRIRDVRPDQLVAEAASGTIVRLDAHSGRLLAVEQPVAATG